MRLEKLGRKTCEDSRRNRIGLIVEGDRPAIFWIILPPSGFQNGRYKVDVSMLYSGDQKDQKSATFDVSGY